MSTQSDVQDVLNQSVDTFLSEITGLLTASEGGFTNKPVISIAAPDGTELIIALSEHFRPGTIVPPR